MSELNSSTKTILSGIQPSGTLHLGNYFGAMRQHIQHQTLGDAYYFIANYHALTSLRDGEALWQNTLNITLDYLALGLDPNKATFFAQSDVPNHAVLSWVLGTLCPVSLMEKGVSYKDKVAAGLSPNIGLFTYPVLQAADILIYQADLVPVGADQKQNLEIARDLAAKFNNQYETELFKIPEPHILKEVAVVPGIDGRKMSKSYGNTIGIFEEGKALKKKIMSIETDSTALEDPKDPETCNVFALIKLFATQEKQNEIAEAYRKGGYGYGHAKKELLSLVTEYFEEARERRKELQQKPQLVLDVLAEGASKARQKTDPFVEQVLETCGLKRPRL